jgi:type IV secretory pathway TrbD component
MNQIANPVFRSLNRRMLLMGVERRLFFFLVTVCFGLFVVSNALLPSLLLFIILWAGVRYVENTDPQLLRIMLNSRKVAVRYDPAKLQPKYLLRVRTKL